MQQNIETTNINASGKQLVKSTMLAVIIAGAILVTVVLPSEFAIDVTGAGKLLGLQGMGEIKQSLARDALNAEEKDLAEQSQALRVLKVTEVQAPESEALETKVAPTVEKKAEPVKLAQAKPVQQKVTSEVTKSYKIKPNDSLELKVTLNKGEEVRYNWQVQGGTLNFDNHGDKPGVNYFNYSKGRNVKSDGGKITAEFDGNHGWFWRNRSASTVTLIMTFSGDYTEIKAPVRN
jgi:hypothetical protein